jgi:hypothetical protein
MNAPGRTLEHITTPASGQLAAATKVVVKMVHL